MRSISALLVVLALGAAGCSSADPAEATTAATDPTTTVGSPDAPAITPEDSTAGTQAPGATSFIAEVWADNWFSLSVNGVPVAEDSVPITTERSFNAETITFEASYPLTIAVVAKDFKENDTGLEYIGTDRQQMGDGGIIIQITDTATGAVVAVSDANWRVFTIHRAPLNPDCERAATPANTCLADIITEPDGWSEPGYDDSSWEAASVFSEAEVSPKDGYDQIDWDPSAQLIWGADLEVDNTILMRLTVG